LAAALRENLRLTGKRFMAAFGSSRTMKRILILNGGAAPFVTQEQLDYRCITCPGARHGFTNPGGRRHRPEV
jgi:hypothetical protein